MIMSKLFCTSDSYSPLVNPLEVHTLTKHQKVTSSSTEFEIKDGREIGFDKAHQTLDWTQWLPFAAKKYNVSADANDYLITPVPIMPSDLANRNGVGFPLKELIEFNTEYGMQAYKTWKGKGTFVEHANEEPLASKGMIVDSFLRPIQGSGGKVWMVVNLLAFDRTKDPDLCRSILKGDMNSYSMGAWVETYTCSYCNAEIGQCAHLHPQEPLDFYMLGDTLVYRKVKKPVGFETSAVATPAYQVAISDVLLSTGDSFGFDGRKKNEDRPPLFN
jgi:hypothetical protein